MGARRYGNRTCRGTCTCRCVIRGRGYMHLSLCLLTPIPGFTHPCPAPCVNVSCCRVQHGPCQDFAPLTLTRAPHTPGATMSRPPCIKTGRPRMRYRHYQDTYSCNHAPPPASMFLAPGCSTGPIGPCALQLPAAVRHPAGPLRHGLCIQAGDKWGGTAGEN